MSFLNSCNCLKTACSSGSTFSLACDNSYYVIMFWNRNCMAVSGQLGSWYQLVSVQYYFILFHCNVLFLCLAMNWISSHSTSGFTSNSPHLTTGCHFPADNDTKIELGTVLTLPCNPGFMPIVFLDQILSFTSIFLTLAMRYKIQWWVIIVKSFIE
jgi:hypothetical protein